MAGKASLLLAAVLFGMGATGLLLTAGETTHWGPFQPGAAPGQAFPGVDSAPLFAQSIIVLPPDGGLAAQAVIEELPTSTRAAVLAETAAPAPAPVATPTPRPPLVLAGVASDDGGAQAAGATPPPIRIIMIAGDGGDEPAPATPEPSPGDAPAVEPGEADAPVTAAPPADETPEPGAEEPAAPAASGD